MAGDDDKPGGGGDASGGGGGGNGGAGGGGGYMTPMLPGGGAPFAYPGMMLAPFTPTAEKDPIKYSDAVPAQVRAELPWLVRTSKLGRMPVGVISTCYRLLLIALDDLEHTYGRSLFRRRPYDRLAHLCRAGAITRAVVEEARPLKLKPPKKPPSASAQVGDAAEAARYVAFLRMLVDVAYEARSKYRTNQLPGPKTQNTTAMTVTVGPPSG